MSEIVILGSLNMDLVVRAERVPLHGETMFGEAFATFPGGKGANQAVAAARLGARVAMIGGVGADGFGGELLAIMQHEGIDTSQIVRSSQAATGVALIMLDHNGHNTMIVVPGANGAVQKKTVLASLEKLGAMKLLVAQFEVAMEAVWAGIAWARAHKIPVLLNAAPARPTAPEAFRGIDYLVVNEQEAECLTGQPVPNPEAAQAAAERMAGWGASAVIVTLGGQGSVVWAEGASVHIPAQKVAVVDSTAAGDAFIGGLANALLKDAPILEAVRYANCAGALATTKLGAMPSLPDAESVRKLYISGS
ncbi:MAG: ribokinase [Chloroflexi bacterium]|nr:ribokinase [Chloroflexota bacterium]